MSSMSVKAINIRSVMNTWNKHYKEKFSLSLQLTEIGQLIEAVETPEPNEMVCVPFKLVHKILSKIDNKKRHAFIGGTLAFLACKPMAFEGEKKGWITVEVLAKVLCEHNNLATLDEIINFLKIHDPTCLDTGRYTQ